MKELEQLTTEYWKWWLEESAKDSPTCHTFDSETNFLPCAAGMGSEPVHYDVTATPDKTLIFPAVTSVYSSAEDKSMRTDEDLRRWAEQDIAKIERKDATLDGKPLPTTKIVNEPFDAIYPEKNRWNGTPGAARTIAAGYWVKVDGLKPGKYDIKTVGSCLSGKIRREANYHLIVS